MKTEILGWIVTFIGLGMAGVVLLLTLDRKIFEGFVLSIPSIFVFRSGVGLIRLSAVSKIAYELEKRNQE